MRMSNLFGLTLRAAPGKTEAGTRCRSGPRSSASLARASSPICHSAWRSMKKIENVMREEMDADRRLGNVDAGRPPC